MKTVVNTRKIKMFINNIQFLQKMMIEVNESSSGSMQLWCHCI